MLSSTFDGVARVAARPPPMAISSNATLSTASWSRSRSLKSTRACEDGKRVRLLTPPCVTRWSGGAVVHDRGALLRRGLRRRKTTHHVVELGSQHYRGQFNVVPGTVFFCGRRWCASSCALSIAGGDVLSTRSTGIFVVGVVVVVQVPRGDGCTARRSVQHGCHGRSGSLTVLLGASAGAEAAARSASSVRALACLLALQINAAPPYAC